VGIDVQSTLTDNGDQYIKNIKSREIVYLNILEFHALYKASKRKRSEIKNETETNYNIQQ
jgi:hypothetical protein